MRTPSGKQSHLRYPLTRLFGSPGNVRVLRVLADGVASTNTQIAKSAGLTPQGARLVLEVLIVQGVVAVQGSSRTQLFELASVHPFRQPILDLFKAEHAAWENLVARLRERLNKRPDVQAAWLYGSVARGEDNPTSDVDVALLVESPEVADEVRNDIMAIEDKLHVHVSITALTSDELAALPEGDKWLTEVVRDSRVLKGRPPELEIKRARALVA